MAIFHFEIENSTIYATLKGVFTIEHVVAYELALMEHVSKVAKYGHWGLIADVRELGVSPIEAVKQANKVTEKLLNKGCKFFINITTNSEPIVEHQLKLASGRHKVYQVNSLVSAQELKQQLLIDS